MLQTYELIDERGNKINAVLFEDMKDFVERFLLFSTGQIITIVFDPNDQRQLNLLGKAYDVAIKSPFRGLF